MKISESPISNPNRFCDGVLDIWESPIIDLCKLEFITY
jgi:hypothetical protein